MAIENMDRLLFGVQFHPESIMTPEGFQIIRKFINFCT
jgi:anthranilate/para-aminobenzoate synthase component II